MRIIEIFNSIEGEGKRAGELATFIRTSGCNLCCKYCDTAYSISGEEGIEMSVPEIIERAKLLACKNITVTGGEPLIQTDIVPLLKRLANEGFDVNVETNGSLCIAPFIAAVDSHSVWYTVDYKTPNSGMRDQMTLEHFLQLRKSDVLKFVVSTQEDLDCTLHVISYVSHLHVYSNAPLFYISPVFGEIELSKIIDFMKENKMFSGVRFQLQLHKYIWDPQARGV